MKGRAILRKEKGNKVLQISSSVLRSCCPEHLVVRDNSKGASSYCAGQRARTVVTLSLASWSNRARKRRDSRDRLICCWALGSRKQDQSSNSIQIEPVGVWPPVGGWGIAVPQTPYTVACPAAELQLQDTFSSPGRWPWGTTTTPLLALSREGSSSPDTHLCLLYPLLPSHCPAVLNAALGRNARPGEKAAEKALGLPIYPLGN